MIHWQYLSSLLMTAKPQLGQYTTAKENTVLCSLITEKTFIDKDITDVLNAKDNSLKLSLDHFIQTYVESLNEIHQEYEDANTESEIAYVFSSPSFRVLLRKTCGEEVGGFYDPANYICISIENALFFTMSLGEFKSRLKDLLRHECHHASKGILHALLPKRPEVNIPCHFITSYLPSRSSNAYTNPYDSDSPNPPDDNSPTAGPVLFNIPQYTPYKQLILKRDLSEPMLPLTQDKITYFLQTMKMDVENLRKWVLSDEFSKDPNVIPLKKNIREFYDPPRWHHDLHLENDAAIIRNISETLQQAAVHCMDIESEDSVFETENVTLCVRNLQPSHHEKWIHAVGYSVPAGKDKLLAFVRDIEWRKARVNQYSEFHLREMETWLYTMHHQVFRSAFPNLEQMRVGEFLKFANRTSTVQPCLNTEVPQNLSQCFQQLCSNDVLLMNSLQKTLNRQRRLQLQSYFSCKPDNLECFIKHITDNILVNVTDSDFLQQLDPFYLEKQWRSQGNVTDLANVTCEHLPLYFSDLATVAVLFAEETWNGIPPWYFLAILMAFACRSEIVPVLNQYQHKLLSFEPPTSKKYRPILSNFLISLCCLYMLFIKGKEIVEYGSCLYMLFIRGKEIVEYGTAETNTGFEEAFISIGTAVLAWKHTLSAIQQNNAPRQYFDLLSLQNPVTQSFAKTVARFKLSFGAAACYDVVSNTKKYYQKKCHKSKQPISCCHRIGWTLQGCLFSIGKLSWKYCARPVLAACFNVIHSFMTPQESVLDTIAKNIIPGAAEIFASQEAGFKEYEQRLQRAQQPFAKPQTNEILKQRNQSKALVIQRSAPSTQGVIRKTLPVRKRQN